MDISLVLNNIVTFLYYWQNIYSLQTKWECKLEYFYWTPSSFPLCLNMPGMIQSVCKLFFSSPCFLYKLAHSHKSVHLELSLFFTSVFLLFLLSVLCFIIYYRCPFFKWICSRHTHVLIFIDLEYWKYIFKYCVAGVVYRDKLGTILINWIGFNCAASFVCKREFKKEGKKESERSWQD